MFYERTAFEKNKNIKSLSVPELVHEGGGLLDEHRHHHPAQVKTKLRLSLNK